jgi:hypothetical protein
MLAATAVINSPAVKRTVHKLMDGALQLFQKPTSCFWQCAATVGGKQFRYSTKKESFAEAQDVAKDWFLSMSGKARAGLITAEKTFQTAAERFTLEYGMITDGQRAVRWVEGHQIRLRLHLLPFFVDLPGLRWLGRLLAIPPFGALAELGYGVFLRTRPLWRSGRRAR